MAANTLLPGLIAAALINSVMEQPGWKEGRKLAGSAFALATAPLLTMEGSKTVGKAALANRENVLRVIDNLMVSLSSLRKAIDREDAEDLQEQIRAALESRESWIHQRKLNDWVALDSPPSMLPTAGDVLGRLIGLRPKSTPKTRNK